MKEVILYILIYLTGYYFGRKSTWKLTPVNWFTTKRTKVPGWGYKFVYKGKSITIGRQKFPDEIRDKKINEILNENTK